jgi:hypothetical protein
VRIKFCSGILCVSLLLGSNASLAWADQSEQVVQAAEQFLAALSEDQRAKVLFSYEDVEQRFRWSNLPQGIFERKGLRMGDLSEEQRDAVMKLLKATLSQEGYLAVTQNIEAEQVLSQRGGGQGRVKFGRDEFYVSLLGKPSLSEPWLWQFGGHHLAVNATIVSNRITLGPTLTGGQPMSFGEGANQVKQMKKEIELAHQLAASLKPDQRSKAVVSDRPGDMILGPGKDHVRPKQEGICATELSQDQKHIIMEIIQERVNLLNQEDAKERLDEIRSEIDETYFLWSGPIGANEAAYYRVHGKSFFLEFAPQRMGGNPQEHVHAMYRDLDNDYGSKWSATKR